MYDNIIKVGSRKSELALIQTRYVICRLEELYPEKKFEIHTMTTIGDRVLNISLPKIGEKSLFTKDLEDALKSGGVDLVVHSLKDLPTALPDGMAIGAILEREDPRDALVLNEKFKGKTLDSLPPGSVIGTSSLRRSAQLARAYPHLQVCDVRGNLNTRLSKLDAADSAMSGLLLAKAGLVRMGWEHRIDQTLDCATSLYAIGQGALAVECRANDAVITDLIAPLTHRDTLLRVLAERSFLKTLGGGCSAPVAISSKLNSLAAETQNMQLTIKGAVWSLDGKIKLEESLDTNIVNSSETEIEDECTSKAKRAKVNESNNEQFHDAKSSDAKPNNEKIKDNVIHDNGVTNGSAMKIKNCPHAMKLTKRSRSSDCPLALPVGQDFMGQCPFLEASNMENIMKCPFKINEDSGDLCCPLRQDPNDKIVNPTACTSSSLQKCPFLAKNEIKIVDYVNNDANSNVTSSAKQMLNIYCGILEHKNIDNSLMERCESLGRQLADVLIKNGALDVMKCAQMQIRSS